MKINTTEFIPKDWMITSLGNNIKILYKGKTCQPKPIILAKEIILNEKLGEFCGLYYGEGATSKNSWTSHIQFTNSDKYIVNYFLSLVEDIFHFNRNSFYFRIKARGNKKTSNPEKKIIRDWVNFLKIYKNRDIKLYWDKEIRDKTTSRIMVTFGSVIFRRILDNLIEKVMKNCLTNRDLRIGFLRGLFAAEGCVALNKGTLFSVIFSQGSKDKIKDDLYGKKQREYIKKLLIIERVIPNNNKKGIAISITNFKNLDKFCKLRLHTLHPDKYTKFENGLIKLKKSKRAGISNNEAKYQILSLLYHKGPLNIQDISRLRDTKKSTTVDIIKGRKDRHKIGLLEKEYIFISKKLKLNYSKKPIEVFDITKKGKKYLDGLKGNFLVNKESPYSLFFQEDKYLR